MSALSTRLRWLMIFSLALNLVLVTAGLTWTLAKGGADRGRADMALGGTPSPRALMRALEADERDLLSGILERRSGELRQATRAAYQSRRAVGEALLAEPFRREDLAAAMAQQRQQGGELTAAAQAVLLDLAVALDAEGRVRLASALRHSGRRDWRERSRGSDAPRPR